jgi:hypothetical protein
MIWRTEVGSLLQTISGVNDDGEWIQWSHKVFHWMRYYQVLQCRAGVHQSREKNESERVYGMPRTHTLDCSRPVIPIQSHNPIQ